MNQPDNKGVPQIPDVIGMNTKATTAYLKGYNAYFDGNTDNFYLYNSRSAGLASWWDKGRSDAEEWATSQPVK